MSDQVSLTFRKAGMLTTVQDLGRSNHQQFGVPVGGVMDKQSAIEANRLVGNLPNTPVLEITIMGPEIEIVGACQIAITGADISAKLNEESVNLYHTIELAEGNNKLKFGRLITGCRAYIAIGGNWKLDTWLDSFSATSFGSEILSNSIIRKWSSILIENPTQKEIIKTPKEEIPHLYSEVILRIIKGPEFENFSKENLDFFFNQKFKISPDSNRMGYRLFPSINGYEQSIEMISSGVIPGTIQITNSGQPIVLTSDAQTVGGYPRIANILMDDLDKIGQLKPGDIVRFRLIN